jgi:hypothetical protein
MNFNQSRYILFGRWLFALLTILVLCISCNVQNEAVSPVDPSSQTPAGESPRFAAEAALPGSLGTQCSEDIVAYGNTLYVADGPGGIKVIDISDKLHPVLAKSISTYYAFRVYINENCLYLCDGPGGFKVFTLDNPKDPVMTYSDDTEWASGLAIHGDYLYLGDMFAGFRIYKVTTPYKPHYVLSKDVSRVRDITFEGEHMMVSDAPFGLATYYFYSPTNPACTYTDGTRMGNFEDIVAYGGFAIIARNDEATRISCWYVADLLRIGLASEYYPARFIDGLALYNNYLLAACGEEGILIFDLSALPQITQVTTVDTPGYARRAKIDNGYLYVADMEGIVIYDLDEIGGGLQ